MSYSKNPNLPKVRAEAVKLLRSGRSTREVARHFGYAHSTIVKWNKKMPADFYNFRVIRTESSQPRSHPAKLSPEVVRAIIEMRHASGRGAEYIHYILTERKGLSVSLSSVKRTLKRNNLTKYSKWKKWHSYPPRPLPEKPGALIQVDTVHRIYGSNRLYVYTLLDVYSRWAHALAVAKIGANPSAVFVRRAVNQASFGFQTIQSDPGPEFSKWFTKKLAEKNIAHRHSRVRTPNDNAHLERFNRTIQDECIGAYPDFNRIRQQVPLWLDFYNQERLHLGLQCKTPLEVLQRS